MKHPILVFCMFMIYAAVSAQNIVHAEYFINNDPGYGNGTAISVSPGKDVTLNFDVNTDGLENGLHTLSIRAKDDNGAWSMVLNRTFLLGNYPFDPIPMLAGAEYFINEDPGYGLGYELTVTPGAIGEIDIVIPLVDIANGLHTVYLRTKDENGRWSQTHSRPFLKLTIPDDPVSITNLEYFIDNDPGVGNGIPVEISPGENVEQSFIIYPGPMPPGEYTLFIRAKDDRGSWSIVFNQTFDVLESEPFLVTFAVEDADKTPIADAIITFNGISHDQGQYNIGNFDPGTYPYMVQREGYFPVSEQIDLVSDTLITVILEIDNTGLDAIHSHSIRIFPNPTSSNINIESPVLIGRIAVTDLSGRIVYNADINESATVVSTREFEPGIYFIHLETRLGVYYEKVVIQK